MDHQRGDGLWETSHMKDRKPRDTPLTRERELWLALNICRVFKRFHE